MNQPTLTQSVKRYTGNQTLTHLHTQVLLHLRANTTTLKDLARKTEKSPSSVLSACLLLNRINLCWWTEDLPSHYYLTAEGHCMLNEIESTAIV